MKIELPESVEVSLDDIIPYENNPRRIPDEAVEAVKKSISEYGYVQPIAVQKSTMQVVVGHTRLQALKRLGETKAMVYLLDIDDEKAKAYRLVDNRTSELSEWDHNALVLELREWETNLVDQFFPDLDLEISKLDASAVTQEEVDLAADEVKRIKPAQVDPLTTVCCPGCKHRFKVKSASLPGLSYGDLDELRARAKE